MAEIPLRNGGVALVDDADFERLSRWTWQHLKNYGNLYAVRFEGQRGKRRCIWMHREILGEKDGSVIDHANGDGLDNRRENLRFASTTQNNRNRRKRANTASKYKGVRVAKCGYKWTAGIEHDGDCVYLGTFETEEAAARQYDRAARVMFGKFARTNQMLGLLKD